MTDLTGKDRRQLIMTLCPDCETGNICPRHTNHKEGLHQTIPPTWNEETTMNDLTDQEKRVLREWANENKLRDEETHLAASYILANVDDPDPTLAEKLRYRADLLDNGDPDGDTPQALRTLADLVDQMERDVAEARAEVETLTYDLAEAESEVGQLTAEKEKFFREEADNWIRNTDSAKSIDPADVQPGEAWLVECDGEERTAVKDGDAYLEWNTVNHEGLYGSADNGDITLITRLVPAPRVITNHDELDEAKRDTVIRDARGVVCSRDNMGNAWTSFTSLADERSLIILPATVLWEPEE